MSTAPATQQNISLEVKVTPDGLKKLDSLRLFTRLASLPHVIRAALSTYHFLIHHHRDGHRLVMVAPEGTKTDLVFTKGVLSYPSKH